MLISTFAVVNWISLFAGVAAVVLLLWADIVIWKTRSGEVAAAILEVTTNSSSFWTRTTWNGICMVLSAVWVYFMYVYTPQVYYPVLVVWLTACVATLIHLQFLRAMVRKYEERIS